MPFSRRRPSVRPAAASNVALQAAARATVVAMDRLEPRQFLAATPASPRPNTLGAAFDKTERQALLDRLDNLPGGTLSSLQSSLNANNVSAFDSTLRSYFQARSNRDFFFDPATVGDIADYVASTIGDGNASDRADDITDSRLFPQDTSTGDYTITLPADINWDNPGVNANSLPDFIHALQRFQYWNDFYQAYLASGNAKYVNEMMYELADWHAQFPTLDTKPSVDDSNEGWMLDNAIRTENFTFTYFALLNDAGWTNAANSLLLYKLVQHGDYLTSSGAAASEFDSNRTLTAAKGLHYLGVMFPELDTAATWATAGRNALYACQDGQFYADGSHVEQSPGYTVGAVEDLLESKYLDQINGTAWPGARSTKLTKAVESYWQILSPDGTRPAISDTYRNTSVAVFLKANKVQGISTFPEAKPRPRDAYLFGKSFAQQNINNPVVPALGSRGDAYAMTDGGYYVMRSDNSANANQIIFDAGPKGGIHGHLDALSFELFGGGRPLIKDPGLYKYIPGNPDRDYVVSTRAHNTVNIDGANQGELEGANNPGLQVSQYTVTGSSVRVTATTRGYQYLTGRPVHTRSVYYDLSGAMLIVDWVEGNTSHTAQQSFNLPADASASPTGVQPDGSFRTRYASGGNVQVVPLTRPGQTVARGSLTFTTDTATGDYKEDAYRYTVTQTGTFLVFATLVNAYTGTSPANTTATLLTTSPTPGGTVQIKLTKNGVDQTISFTPPAFDRPDANATDRGTDNDIAWDSAGRLHKVYFDRDDRNLKYTVRETNGLWSIPEVIDDGLDCGLYPSLDIAPNGTPGVAYFDGQNGDLKFAELSRVFNSWQIQTVDSAGSVGLYPSLKYSRKSGAVIAYYNRTKGQLRLATVQTNGFDVQVLDGNNTNATTDVGRFPSLQLDPNRPDSSKYAIAYEDTRNGTYKYTIQKGTGWATAVVDTDLKLAGGYSSLAFYDTNGSDPTVRYRPAVSYYDAGDTALKYSYFDGSAWNPQTVASAKIQGLYTNLFFTGAAGKQKPNIYFFDRTNNLAKRALGSSPTGTWGFVTLAPGGRALATAASAFGTAYTSLDENAGTLKVLFV
jgi:hypothetical protein